MSLASGLVSLASRIATEFNTVRTEIAAIGGGNPSFYPLPAEENSALSAGSFEWAIGNGSNTPNGRGVVIYVPAGWTCEIVAMSLDLNGGSATVEINHDGVNKGVSDGAEVVSSGVATVNEFATPLPISNGDNVNFRTRLASGTSQSNRVCAWFRMTPP